MSSGFNRRDFSKAAVTAAAAGAASTLAPARVLGASDQVRLGFIGVGNRGCQLLKAFLAHPDAKIGALCDVYAPYLNAEYDKVDPRFASLGQRIPRMAELPADVARVKDFRTVLDRPDIDAVVIATPDHWHAIQTIAACKAGKDVYVEKPLSITIAEGRAMVDAARRHERIVQVGTHRRSSRMYIHIAELVRSGVLGKVTVARASYCSNMATQGIGRAPESDSLITSKAESGPSPTSRKDIARPPSPTWRTSQWRPGNASSGTPGPSASSTATKPTVFCTMNTAGLRPWPDRGMIMAMTTQVRLSSPRFFCNTGASGKCLSSQRVRPQSTRRGATVLVRTKSFPCQDRVIWRWWRSMARIVARATVSGDIVRRSFTETRAVLTTMFSSKEVSVNPGLT